MEKGYVQVYTGDGKGKTTAALGLALRAVGRGLKVVIFQFLKSSFSGELESALRLTPKLEILRFNLMEKLLWEMSGEEREQLKEATALGFIKARMMAMEGSFDIIILDEIMGVLNQGFLSNADVCQLMDEKAPSVELILTGRNAPREIVERANLVTEMRAVKHYQEQGITARDGIER
ncbi:MAG: Cob(I)yrinic acid a,c-diamide adenosyltransferase [Dehalococcoidia bacterium]|nr:Cob(I)yrinic acid a,c-diamide adenosyltransferase [Bacillota bacterium]